MQVHGSHGLLNEGGIGADPFQALLQCLKMYARACGIARIGCLKQIALGGLP